MAGFDGSDVRTTKQEFPNSCGSSLAGPVQEGQHEDVQDTGIEFNSQLPGVSALLELSQEGFMDVLSYKAPQGQCKCSLSTNEVKSLTWRDPSTSCFTLLWVSRAHQSHQTIPIYKEDQASWSSTGKEGANQPVPGSGSPSLGHWCHQSRAAGPPRAAVAQRLPQCTAQNRAYCLIIPALSHKEELGHGVPYFHSPPPVPSSCSIAQVLGWPRVLQPHCWRRGAASPITHRARLGQHNCFWRWGDSCMGLGLMDQ